MMDVEQTAREIRLAVTALPAANTESLRSVRKRFTKAFEGCSR